MKHLFVVFLFASIRSAVHTPGPVAKYSFNDGTARNECGINPAKTVDIVFVEDRFGNPRSACHLHGAPGSYINLGTDSVLKPFEGSISIWVNIDIAAEGGKGYHFNPIILTKNTYLNTENKNDDFFEAYTLGYDFKSHKIAAATTKSEELQVILRSDRLSLREWHHLVMTYNDDSLHLYIDGALSAKIMKNFRTVFSKTDSVMVGNSANAKNERYLSGRVDDIAIYNRVLSAEEVAELYNAPDPNRFSIYIKWTMWILVTLVVMSLIILLVVKRQKRKFEKEKMAERLIADYKLIAIKAQINPHFMSNCLSSIQKLIYSGEIDKAGEYVAKFSVFLRQVLDYSEKHFLTLQEETTLIKLYVELEQLRFKGDFVFELNIEPDLPVSELMVPALISQPFIENAIWHGLLPLKDKAPRLTLRVYSKKGLICIEIEDNGIGRKNAELLPAKKSKGIKLADEKIKNVNQLVNSSDNKIEIIDLFDEQKNPVGTKVIIQLSHYTLDE